MQLNLIVICISLLLLNVSCAPLKYTCSRKGYEDYLKAYPSKCVDDCEEYKE